jgi:predicted ribosomally synthesized peptide with SipW-like signal peptide
MNNKRATKRALLTSVMALVMCVVMLVGTTFAWFTDTASTGVNKIQAGNLKMKVTYKNTVDGAFTEVSKETPVFNNDARWEPGHVEFVVLKVKNIGTLALKYKLGINIASETDSTNVFNKPFKLSNSIRFAVIDGDQSNLGRDKLVAEAGAGTVLNAGYTDEDHHLVPAAKADATTFSEKTVTLVVWMPKSVGNEANYDAAVAKAPVINLGINVVATQDTVERDSFDEKYDKDATYPVIVSNQQQANDAITNAADKKVNISIASGQTITLDSGIAHEGDKSRDVTFVGDGTQTVDVVAKSVNAAEGSEMNYQRGSSFAFQNVTVQGGTTTYGGIVCNELTFENCTIKGKLTLYGKATFINCVFENTMVNQYSIWTWGGTDVTFEGCTFNTNGKAILLFGEEKTTNLTVNNCVFNDRNNGAAGKAAIEIGEANYGKHNNFTVVINGSTVASGFAVNSEGTSTNSKLWANKNSMSDQYLSVTIDGTKIQ